MTIEEEKICPLLTNAYGKASPCILEECAWYSKGIIGGNCAFLEASTSLLSLSKDGVSVFDGREF